MESTSVCDSANDCSENLDSACESHVQHFHTEIRRSRRTSKKLKILLADPNVDVWMLDEVHFQQHGTSCRMWIPPEIKDPVLLHAPTRKSIGYFGAVRLRDGKFVWSREKEVFDGETFATFLRKLRGKAIRSHRKVVVVLDNARYHHAKLHKEWRELCQEYFTLLFLPPYSPELNTIERTWKLTRRLCTHNRYFVTLNEVISSVEKEFRQWSSPNDQLRRLCSFT